MRSLFRLLVQLVREKSQEKSWYWETPAFTPSKKIYFTDYNKKKGKSKSYWIDGGWGDWPTAWFQVTLAAC